MISTDCQLIHADLTYKVRGSIFEVYNTLGYGHKEDIYQKSLAKEFEKRQIPFEIDNKIIIELKAVEFMPKSYEEQLIHYLKTTGFEIGLLVNFGSPRLFIKRLIWTNPCKSVCNPCESEKI